MIFNEIHAIKSLRPTSDWTICDGNLVWIDTNTTAPTEAEINAEIARLQAEYEAKQYQRNRAAEYPPIADQLDTLYHGGYDAWKAQVKAIKDKYPKA